MKLFITGTDTHVGKTYVSVALLNHFNQKKLSTIALKPVASGCIRRHHQLYNEDALALQKAASISLDYKKINPFAFEPAIAPHLAADAVRSTLSVARIIEASRDALSHPADVHLIEGIGGWYTPLNQTETMADVVIQLNLSVILVVGIRLGCLNHALLTEQALQKDKVKITGWIANQIDPEMSYRDENIATLKKRLTIPCLGVMRYQHMSKNFSDSEWLSRKRIRISPLK